MVAPSPERTPTIERLLRLPRSERLDALRTVVETEFRQALLMTVEDYLPVDESYFDLGLTSLSMSALRQRIEDLLGVTLDATVLFNEPTLTRFMAYLQRDALATVVGDPIGPTEITPAEPDDLMQELLAELG